MSNFVPIISNNLIVSRFYLLEKSIHLIYLLYKHNQQLHYCHIDIGSRKFTKFNIDLLLEQWTYNVFLK